MRYLVMSMNGFDVRRDEYATVVAAQRRVRLMRRHGWAVVVLWAEGVSECTKT